MTEEESRDLERVKLEREVQKIEAEIAALSRPWWQRPAYWAAMIPALAAIIAVAIGSTKEYLETQVKVIELQREKVSRDSDSLKEQEHELSRKGTAIAEHSSRLEDQGRRNAETEAKLKKQERQLAEAELRWRREAELAPVKVQLDMLAENADHWQLPHTDAAKKLAELLKAKDPKTKQIALNAIVDRLDRKDLPANLKFALWYVL